MTTLAIPPDAQEWLEKGRSDVALWALRGLGIELHEAQIEAAIATITGDAQYDLLTWANRAGKTTLVDILHMHRLWYKLGVEPARPDDERDHERWLLVDYRTLHCAPISRLAGRAHQVATEVLKGVSPAQRDYLGGGYRPAPLAPFFATTRERIETGADKMFLRCITGGVCEFDTTEGGGGRLEGVAYRFISWDEWPQQEAADKAEAIRAILTRLTNRAADFDAVILLTGTITPETEHIAKEWLALCEDPDNPDWWGNHASRSLNPSASSKAIARAERTLDREDYDRTVLGIPGGVKGRLFPSILVDPAFVDLPLFSPKVEGAEYLHVWDIALTTADNVGIVLQFPPNWMFSVANPIVGVRFKVLPGSRTLTPAEIVHTIEETFLPYGGRIVLDTTDAHGKGVQRDLRNRGYPAFEFDFHGRDPRGGILKDRAIEYARKLLGEGLEPVRDTAGEAVRDTDGVVRIDLEKPYGVVRFPRGWTKLRDQLALLREDDRAQKKDAAMAFLILAYEAYRKRRAKTHREQGTRFAVFANRGYGDGG
jgi:hypothetical protein